MAARYNEGKALDAVIRRIEARDGTSRAGDGRSPDDLGDPDPQRRVDYVCTVGAQLHAFEHTGIEPFGDHIEMSVHNGALFGPVEERFDGMRSDAEFWELYVPVVASVGLTMPKVKQVQAALIGWIDANAMSFPLARYGDRFSNIAMGETVDGVPFGVSLQRWSLDGIGVTNSPLCGRFALKYCVENDVEVARLARLQKVCEDKFPKLAEWKRSDNARTILVLEENDISLTNHQGRCRRDGAGRSRRGRSAGRDFPRQHPHRQSVVGDLPAARGQDLLRRR